ncbi:MAG: TRAP transporter substrate-binding protein DctP [Acidobacteriota bacterium]|jgi:TRAP-type C4-dicarboxylate transport system substrate-binding protein|nr:TRAP transporter substrate-binding protein DctP [Acidobacteriota bacterium]
MPFARIFLTCLIALLIAPTVGAQSVRLKIATMAPDGTIWMKGLQKAADEVKERTDGRVSFRFYPGGTMGTDSAVLRKIRIGQLHGGVVLAGSLADIDPDMEIYSLPLLFRSNGEVDYVRERMDQVLIDGLEAKGFVSFGLTETGFTYLMSAKPTRTFADLKGRKAWMMQDDPVSLAIVEEAGLSPVPLPISDVLTGLQTGLIDSVAAPAVGAIALQWFTKAKYLTDLPITYVCGTTVVSTKAFNRMSAGDQEIVREVLGRANRELNATSRSDNAEAREALAAQGVEFVNPTDETRAKWDEIAAAATKRLVAQRDYNPATMAMIEDLVQEYRSQQPAGATGD